VQAGGGQTSHTARSAGPGGAPRRTVRVRVSRTTTRTMAGGGAAVWGRGLVDRGRDGRRRSARQLSGHRHWRVADTEWGAGTVGKPARRNAKTTIGGVVTLGAAVGVAASWVKAVSALGGVPVSARVCDTLRVAADSPDAPYFLRMLPDVLAQAGTPRQRIRGVAGSDRRGDAQRRGDLILRQTDAKTLSHRHGVSEESAERIATPDSRRCGLTFDQR
jgi:hypothetical protein